MVMLWTTATAVAAFAASLNYLRPALGLHRARRRRSCMRCCARPRRVLHARGAHARARWLLTRRWPSCPYAVFHLVFQETITVRYALPLVVPVAYPRGARISTAPSRRRGCSARRPRVGRSVRSWCRPRSAYGRGQPASDRCAMLAARHRPQRASRPHVVAMHRRLWTESRRGSGSDRSAGRVLAGAARLRVAGADASLAGAGPSTRVVRRRSAPNRPRADRSAPAGALARVSLAVQQPAIVGGARPGRGRSGTRCAGRDGILEQGWALTPEAAGVTAARRLGPHRRPSVGWIRAPREARR